MAPLKGVRCLLDAVVDDDELLAHNRSEDQTEQDGSYRQLAKRIGMHWKRVRSYGRLVFSSQKPCLLTIKISY